MTSAGRYSLQTRFPCGMRYAWQVQRSAWMITVSCSNCHADNLKFPLESDIEPICRVTAGSRPQCAATNDGTSRFSTRRGERAYSRKRAFHVLLISSASYTECALYLARANDGQTAGPSNYRECFTNDCRGSEILEILREFD